MEKEFSNSETAGSWTLNEKEKCGHPLTILELKGYPNLQFGASIFSSVWFNQQLPC